eukprot:snap_masked-scaffold_11-processed-gene-12.44-mRNA-1 protein AED:1.00 eAED:1.00 QI:0/0/0/0/1/1/3/0/115
MDVRYSCRGIWQKKVRGEYYSLKIYHASSFARYANFIILQSSNTRGNSTEDNHFLLTTSTLEKKRVHFSLDSLVTQECLPSNKKRALKSRRQISSIYYHGYLKRKYTMDMRYYIA